MLEPEFVELFISTVKVAEPLSADDYGFTAYGADVDLACRLEPRSKVMVSPKGEMQTCTGVAYMAAYLYLSTKYRLQVPDATLPDGWREVTILQVELNYDEEGPHHMVVHFGER